MTDEETPPVDCLVLGFYEYPFSEYVEVLRGIGEDSGAWQDISLAHVMLDGRPQHALDVLNHFRREEDTSAARLHNADFLWPVVAYLTQFLRRRGLRADYVNLPHLEGAELAEKLAAPVRLVAITTTVYVTPFPILSLVREIRRLNCDVEIVIGGPFIFNQAEQKDAEWQAQSFEQLGADYYIVSREGEESLAALATTLRDGGSLETVPNLAFRRGQRFERTATQVEANDLSQDVIDFRPFAVERPLEFLSLRTAKSCPFACAFCGFPQRAGSYRTLDIDGVRQQLNAVAELGTVSSLTFLDDTFNVPRRRFRALLKMMIDERFGFTWNCFYRADKGDEEIIDLMAQAGCEGVFLGVESGSDAMLERMNKSARRRHYMEAIEGFRAVGITTFASLIVGFPGETDETVQETVSFVENSRPDYYRAQLWYADPMTPIWKDRHAVGLVGSGFTWTHNTMSAEAACRWIDHMFLNLEASEWLPQFGFEPWSLYYLRRKGMSPAQTRAFLNAFNRAIRHRIRTGAAEVPAGLRAELRAHTIEAAARDDALLGAAGGPIASL